MEINRDPWNYQMRHEKMLDFLKLAWLTSWFSWILCCFACLAQWTKGGRLFHPDQLRFSNSTPFATFSECEKTTVWFQSSRGTNIRKTTDMFNCTFCSETGGKHIRAKATQAQHEFWHCLHGPLRGAQKHESKAVGTIISNKTGTFRGVNSSRRSERTYMNCCWELKCSMMHQLRKRNFGALWSGMASKRQTRVSIKLYGAWHNKGVFFLSLNSGLQS